MGLIIFFSGCTTGFGSSIRVMKSSGSKCLLPETLAAVLNCCLDLMRELTWAFMRMTVTARGLIHMGL